MELLELSAADEALVLMMGRDDDDADEEFIDDLDEDEDDDDLDEDEDDDDFDDD